VVVMEVYAAREDPEPGVTGELITSKVTHDRVQYVPGREETVRTVVGLARPGDIVLTMGAGDVTELGPQIMAALAEQAGADTAGSGVQSGTPWKAGGPPVKAEEGRVTERTRSDPWKIAFVVLLVVSLVCVVTWILLGSRLLVVRDVAVTGVDRIRPEDVVAAVDVETGTPLARVDLDSGRERAESLDLVESAEVTRGWPVTLRVEVVERRPLLAVRVGEEYRLVDGDGVRIEDSRTRPEDHPLIKVTRSEEHTSELQSRFDLVCRLLLEKKKDHSR